MNYHDSHKRLRVWKEAIHLAKLVYRLQQKFPKYETYGLCDQIRRAAISIPTNIAEGNARLHDKERRQFFNIAMGSLAELHSLLDIARELNYLEASEVTEIEMPELFVNVSKMLVGLVSGHATSPN
jgi:four helix bundle protein